MLALLIMAWVAVVILLGVGAFLIVLTLLANAMRSVPGPLRTDDHIMLGVGLAFVALAIFFAFLLVKGY